MSKKDRTKAAALDQSPSHLLHRALQYALDVYADEVGVEAATQRQFAVLKAVAEREGLTQTDLVHATGIDRSTLADLVARMIRRGLLARERSGSDARANAVSLTEGGRAALVEIGPKAEAADARILDTVSKGKRQAFMSALQALAEADPRGGPPAKSKKSKKKKRKAKKVEAEAVAA